MSICKFRVFRYHNMTLRFIFIIYNSVVFLYRMLLMEDTFQIRRT